MSVLDNKVRNTAIVSVVVTIAVIAAFAATFVAGVNYQKGSEAAVQSKVNAAVQSVK